MLEQYYIHSNGSGPPLKVGLLVDELVQPAWIATVLDHIRCSDFARIELVVINAEKPAGFGEARAPLPVRVFKRLRDQKRRKLFLYGLYTTLESRLLSIPDDPFTPVDCTGALAGVPQISIEPMRKGFVHRFREEDIKAIRAYDVDVMLRFGFNILKGEILNVPRHGMWSYHHGDNDWYRGGPAHFWEMHENHPESGVLLQVLNEQLDGGTVLCKATAATQPALWTKHNRVQPFWTGSWFAIRKLLELHEHGQDRLIQRAVPNRLMPGRDKIYRNPENGPMVRFLAPRLWSRFRNRLPRTRNVYHWRMAVRRGREHFWNPGEPLTAEGFQWIDSPRGHFWADPFLFEHEDRTWLFFEDFLYGERRGVIACSEVLPDGTLKAPERVLDRPYHMSFPFVFEHAGHVYMVPETGANQTVELYRARRFPDEWVLEKVLFEGANALDTVLLRHEDRFWWFVTLVDPPAAAPQLFLFHSETLTGSWKYHPANPVSMHIRTSRNAGAIFTAGGRMYRPSQNGAPYYGYSCNLHEIVTLTPDEYDEKLVATMEPDGSGDCIGMHSYSRSRCFEAIDGQMLSPLRDHLP